MKKLVLLLAVAFSVSMFSCKKANTTEPAVEAEATEVAVEETTDSVPCCADTCAADTTVAETVETAAE